MVMEEWYHYNTFQVKRLCRAGSKLIFCGFSVDQRYFCVVYFRKGKFCHNNLLYFLFNPVDRCTINITPYGLLTAPDSIFFLKIFYTCTICCDATVAVVYKVSQSSIFNLIRVCGSAYFIFYI